MKVNIELTWSKLMALILIITATALEFKFDKGGTIFMFTIPFAVTLITGKQIVDGQIKKKTVEKNGTND